MGYLAHMGDKRAMLRHFLGAIVYRTQKALRDAPANFGEFRAGHEVRTPAELVRHMTSVLGYARTHFVGGRYSPQPLPTLAAEVARFHEMLTDLAAHLERDTELQGIQPEQLLQGPFADAMTHAGQLAMLRRLAGAPVPPRELHCGRHKSKAARVQVRPFYAGKSRSSMARVTTDLGSADDRLGLRQKFTGFPPLRGRHGELPLECSRKSDFRFVSDVSGDLRHRTGSHASVAPPPAFASASGR